jgi:hypothetical protein
MRLFVISSIAALVLAVPAGSSAAPHIEMSNEENGGGACEPVYVGQNCVDLRYIQLCNPIYRDPCTGQTWGG